MKTFIQEQSQGDTAKHDSTASKPDTEKKDSTATAADAKPDAPKPKVIKTTKIIKRVLKKKLKRRRKSSDDKSGSGTSSVTSRSGKQTY